ncbi:MAG TPA: GDP-L-fucose synthase [Candidatus Omnitrophota bacterium]|nr:GDP-L-fucose synthase [Candidatus Omnitrophota bacterium]
MKNTTRVFIVGHNDSIENSLRRHFMSRGFRHVFSNTKDRVDVLNQAKVQRFFKDVRPEYVFLGSVRSGGIAANLKYPAEFIYENCAAQNNVIHAAYAHKAKKLLYFSGSCAYPKDAGQPIQEKALLTGPLEETSEPYSVAKIAGIVMCRAYRAQYGFNAIVAVPATLYGPGSDTDIATAHVMGALIAKFHKAAADGDKQVVVWGTGKARREFLHVDDFVSACLFLMDRYNGEELINIGCGHDVSIRELAGLLKKISGFRGKIVFDASKPDGTMRKLMDNRRITRLGWKPKVGLEEGIRKTYQWFKSSVGARHAVPVQGKEIA